LLRGTDVYDDVYPVALRRKVGMAFSEPKPFPKSIRDNVAHGLRVQGFDGDVEDRVVRALKVAALWEEVHDLLEDSGLEMSSGQHRRICTARAIAADPAVVLMERRRRRSTRSPPRR